MFNLFQLISQMGNSLYHQLMEVTLSGPGAIKPLHRGTEEEFAERRKGLKFPIKLKLF